MLALVIVTFVVSNAFLPRDKAVDRAMLGHDFTAFYSAGHFAALGQFDKLYDIEAIKDNEQEIGRRAGLSLGNAYGPYWNPPFYAWVFAPLSHLPYGDALLAWTLINVACLAAATVLLCRMLAPPGQSLREAGIDWKTWGLVPLLVGCSMPLLQCLSHGQNTCTSLLLLTITVTFWRTGQSFRAGMIAGLLFYKPQLGAIVAAVLVLNQGWRALFGLAVTGVVLLLITITTMPGALGSFLHQLPANVRFMQVEHAYVWERHVTLKAFWRLLFQGRAAGEAGLFVTLLAGAGCVALGVSLFRVLLGSNAKNALGCQSDSLIAATVATMPLLMPFYFDYDLLLVAVPAVLFAGGELRRSTGFQPVTCVTDRRLLRAWIALYAWLLINPGMAATTRVNLAVPLLCAVAAMLIARALPRAAKDAAIPLPAVTLPARPKAA